jgi:hypothetical protein
MMRRLVALGLLAACTPAGAEPYPFEGTWDCEVGTFVFTAEAYDPGDGPMAIQDIAGSDGVYILTFEDSYQLGLALQPDGTMVWSSAVSGDMFTCRPLD